MTQRKLLLRQPILIILVALATLVACAPPPPEASANEVPIVAQPLATRHSLARSASDGPPATPAGDTEPVVVKGVLLPFLTYAPLFIAKEEGYFTANGIDMQFIELNSGQEATPALIQGDIDVSSLTVNAGLINAIGRGGQARMVSSAMRFDEGNCSFAGLVGRPDLDLDAIAADGQSLLHLATNPAGTEGYYTDLFLQQYGLSLANQAVEDLPPPALAEALATGAMDMAHAAEPWLTRILAEGDASLVTSAAAVSPGLQFSAILFGPNLLARSPETGRRWMAAYLQGVRQSNQGKTPRNLEITAKYTGLDADLLDQVCWPQIPEDGHVNMASVMEFQQWALERDLIDKVVPADQLYDPSFVDAAAAGLSP